MGLEILPENQTQESSSLKMYHYTSDRFNSRWVNLATQSLGAPRSWLARFENWGIRSHPNYACLHVGAGKPIRGGLVPPCVTGQS